MYTQVIAENLPRVRESVEEAAGRSGRGPGAVRLIAVTKGHPVDAVRAALDAGLGTVGENRLDELVSKQASVGRDACQWHMIGHLQGRKASLVHDVVDLVHSVDSIRLAERLHRTREAGVCTGPISVLVQVNTSGEESKGGIGVEGAEEELGRIMDLSGLEVRGLMTMAPWTDDEGVLRSAFSCLRVLSERLRRGDTRLGPELSMGMSNDYPIAVEEGSTMIRIGTALLGERPK